MTATNHHYDLKRGCSVQRRRSSFYSSQIEGFDAIFTTSSRFDLFLVLMYILLGMEQYSHGRRDCNGKNFFSTANLIIMKYKMVQKYLFRSLHMLADVPWCFHQKRNGICWIKIQSPKKTLRHSKWLKTFFPLICTH